MLFRVVMVMLVVCPVALKAEAEMATNQIVIEQVGRETHAVTTQHEDYVFDDGESFRITQQGDGNSIESWRDEDRHMMEVYQKGQGNRVVIHQSR